MRPLMPNVRRRPSGALLQAIFGAIGQKAKSLGMSWEQEYVSSQAVTGGDTRHLPSQVSHDGGPKFR
jgi:hypothetical protein